MAGSSGSGDDVEAGRTNWAESTTVFQGGKPDELDVQFNGLAVVEAGPRRDDQRPEVVNGIIGRGWNGPNLAIGPGAGVIGVGAPNRGPGTVGIGGGRRISSPLLGSPGNLGESGLGGTGGVGIGGDGSPTQDTADADDVATTAPSRPGAGLVGLGGVSFFSAPVAAGDPGTGNGPGVVGIAGGLDRADRWDLDQAQLGEASNVGVVGIGGDGPKPVGFGSDQVGPTDAGTGVRGVGGVVSGAGITTRGGPGVVGVAGSVAVPGDRDLVDIGVVGVAGSGIGVRGRSETGPGVLGRSDEGPGVTGSSGTDRGGVFASARAAQVHLRPLFETTQLPCDGQPGDLLAISPLRDGEPDGSAQGVASLWFCTRARDRERAATWARVAFDGIATCEQPTIPNPPQNRPTLRD
jgi:hypothetical protein